METKHEGLTGGLCKSFAYFYKKSFVCLGATSSLRNWELVCQPGYSSLWNMPRILPGSVKSLLCLQALSMGWCCSDKNIAGPRVSLSFWGHCLRRGLPSLTGPFWTLNLSWGLSTPSGVPDPAWSIQYLHQVLIGAGPT